MQNKNELQERCLTSFAFISNNWNANSTTTAISSNIRREELQLDVCYYLRWKCVQRDKMSTESAEKGQLLSRDR